MSEQGVNRRRFLMTGAAAGALVLVGCTSGSSGSSRREGRPGKRAGAYEVGEFEGPEIVTDPSRFPTAFHEAPALTSLVAAGKLPPVKERIGQDPLVIDPVHEVGKYGGTMRRGIVGQDFRNAHQLMTGPDVLVYPTKDGNVPYLARSFEANDEATEFTLSLRRGMRWSDGQPFTADDIMFWYEDLYRDERLGGYPSQWLQIDGKDVTVERIDDFTVRFRAPKSYFLFVDAFLAATDRIDPLTLGFAPKHYLSKFHPKYVGLEKANRQAAAAKFKDWVEYLLLDRADFTLNAELPVVFPWKVAKGNELSTDHLKVERNPYSIWVDVDGNQLPYIDSVTFANAGEQENLNLSAISGDYDFQDRNLEQTKLPLLLENQRRSDYTLRLDPSVSLDMGIRINLSYHKDEVIGDLLRTTDFRRALSMGIDRDQLNQGFFLGVAQPMGFCPGPDTPYFPGDEWLTKWATHDVAQAGQLLDGLGLRMGPDGFRRRKDGKRLRLEYLTLSQSVADYVGMGEMIKQHWKQIGIDVNVQGVSGELAVERAQANLTQLVGTGPVPDDPFLLPTFAFPSTDTGFVANGVLYGRWFRTNGAKGEEPFPELKALMELQRRGFAASPDERVAIGKQWTRQAADLCLQIGCIGQSVLTYGMHLAKNNVGNIPSRFDNDGFRRIQLNPIGMLPQTFYFKS